MAGNRQVTGRARTVLVLGQGNSQKAVVSDIVAGSAGETDSDRLSFGGIVGFSAPLIDHIRKVILPITERILVELGLPQYNIEISAVNLGAASMMDIGMDISGFSADVAVFVAMLSEMLQIPLSNDFVATGHIASVDGDIRAVKAIPAKLDAAQADKSIRRFIYPDLDNDTSLEALSPHERERSIQAVMTVRDSIGTEAVGTIAELVEKVFTDADIVLAALQRGFFSAPKTPLKSDRPIEAIVKFLAGRNEQRFWSVLERFLLTGQSGKAKELLQALAQYYIRRKKYPAHLGGKLLRLLFSLPPAIKRMKIEFPLLDTGICIKLSQFARVSDHKDVCRLFEAIQGKGLSQSIDIVTDEEPKAREISDPDSRVFDTVIAQINEQALAGKIGVPIDSARASYILDSATVPSYDHFAETITAFYGHLQRYIDPDPAGFPDEGKNRAEAWELLERTFRDQGGPNAALARAVDGIQGGMRIILDAVTEQYKGEEQAKYVKRIFKDTLNNLDWDGRVNFMRAALKRLGPFLPAEVKSQPPEQFVEHYEPIITTYVRSSDKVNQLLRTM